MLKVGPINENHENPVQLLQAQVQDPIHPGKT